MLKTCLANRRGLIYGAPVEKFTRPASSASFDIPFSFNATKHCRGIVRKRKPGAFLATPPLLEFSSASCSSTSWQLKSELPARTPMQGEESTLWFGMRSSGAFPFR